MKGELKIQRDPTRRKFRCPVWTVTLFAWEFPLDKFRKRVVAAIRKMDGFVGWCDPKVFFHEDDRGMLYFALFDSQAHGEAARDLIRAEFPQQSVGANCCLHYAAREPIEQESKSDTGFTEFLAKMIQNSVNEGTKHNE